MKSGESSCGREEGRDSPPGVLAGDSSVSIRMLAFICSWSWSSALPARMATEQRQQREPLPHHASGSRGRRERMLGVPKGVAQYLALTMLRTQSESSIAPMMTLLLTRRGSCRLRSDGFISPSSSSRRSRRLPAGAPTRPRSGAPRPKRPPFAAPSDLLLSLRSRRRKGGRASWHRQGMGTGARTRKEGSRCFA